MLKSAPVYSRTMREQPMSTPRFLLLACLCAMLSGPRAAGVEGKWTPWQVLELDPAWLRQLGLQLPPERLWDPRRATGLLAAAVNIGGCSAGFVSETGLILTNHHCLFSLLQEHSTPQRDLITHGFLARSPEEELPGRTTRVTVPRRFTDVTRQVLEAVPAGATDLQRYEAIERRQKELVAECERQPGARCRVAVFDGGVQYVLVESFELSDVRLVYAPPRSIGEYGGEVDNWMWPRHTGDFALARAYRDGKPYRPEFWFPISREGVRPGDFVMVLGYPGRTLRSLTAAEMALQRDGFFALRAQIYGEWIQLLEQASKGSREGEIAVASTLKSLHNVVKNAQGQLAGLARGRIIEKQAEQEKQVEAWAAQRPEWRAAIEARRELDRRAADRRRTMLRDFLLQSIPNGPIALRHATQLVRLAAERAKPDMEREPDYMERELPRLRARLERDQKSFFRPADEALMRSWLRHALALPAGARIAAVHAAFREPGLDEAVARLYASTKVTSLEERMKMFGETVEQLRARRDPLLDFAFALEGELRAFDRAQREQEGAVSRLRPAWRRAVMAHAGRPIAPDANGTLRVSFAHVKGYSPREAVEYLPQTTLAGMLEKHTGQEPFALPASLLEAASKADPSQVPLNFLADADTTGGNSGSPTVNGRGELVGLNFDRVWENVANDFGYNPAIARNVNVDIRFFLWLLEHVDRADGLLKELGVRR
jgi:hypothetical protein